MKKSKNAKTFSLIAAICYTVYSIVFIINPIISSYYSATDTAFSVIFCIASLSMAVTVFMKDKKAAAAAAGVNALFYACYAYYFISQFNSFDYVSICNFVAYAGAVVLIVLYIKGNSAVKMIWCVPALMLLFGFMINWINGGYFSYFYNRWKEVLFSLVEIAALLFVGMRFKEDFTSAKAAPVNEYATFNPQNVYSDTDSSAIGGIEQNIVIKGTPQENKPALITIIVGAILLPASFIVATSVFEYCEGYDIRFGKFYYWTIIYDTFGEFFTEEFFNFKCFYGYMIMLGIIVLIVGIIMKLNTEKCEITVTNEAISGNLPHGKATNIPLNQITAINPCSFNGVSITSIGNVSNFYCIENRKEVIKAISYLLTNPQQDVSQSDQAKSAVSEISNDAERLMRLKKLLDAGALTQEEFDAKKKQILG